jgi:hypothetical protein
MFKKSTIKTQIWMKVDSIWKLIYKLEFSEKHSERVNEIRESKMLDTLWNIGDKKTVYQKYKKDELFELLEEAGKILTELEEMEKEVQVYVAGGVEFADYDEVVGVSYIRKSFYWSTFLRTVHGAFNKPITFMVRKTNEKEMKIKENWNLEVMKETSDYYKCLIPVEDQIKMSYKDDVIIMVSEEKWRKIKS